MATRPAAGITLTGVDELFGIGPGVEVDPGSEKGVDVPVSDLYAFKDHPYSVVDDKEMQNLAESVKTYGVLTPAIVRPRPEGGYEMVSGHRRKRGCELAGVETMPAIVREMDNDTAVILMVDSNYQRENVKPSEKAKAYKMKLDALTRQGERSDLTSTQVGQKLETNKTSVEIVAEEAGESSSQVQRIIRLNKLQPELLEKVDANVLKFTPAVEISYLAPDEQKHVAEMMEIEGRTPNLAQAMELKRLSQENKLDKDKIENIFVQPRPQEARRVVLQGERLDKYFPASMTPVQIEEKVYKALDEQKKRDKQKNDRDAR